jgi:hypothetical protein
MTGYTLMWHETWKWIEKIADGRPLFDYSKTITKGDSDEVKILFYFIFFEIERKTPSIPDDIKNNGWPKLKKK